mmetsp:Transcript_9895/g.29101  ORF Transcript_9895/g.29101 Transcript_9895/m.29101 type:complete len:253 (-) Transcript_9895:180-938(-)
MFPGSSLAPLRTTGRAPSASPCNARTSTSIQTMTSPSPRASASFWATRTGGSPSPRSSGMRYTAGRTGLGPRRTCGIRASGRCLRRTSGRSCARSAQSQSTSRPMWRSAGASWTYAITRILCWEPNPRKSGSRRRTRSFATKQARCDSGWMPSKSASTPPRKLSTTTCSRTSSPLIQCTARRASQSPRLQASPSSKDLGIATPFACGTSSALSTTGEIFDLMSMLPTTGWFFIGRQWLRTSRIYCLVLSRSA